MTKPEFEEVENAETSFKSLSILEPKKFLLDEEGEINGFICTSCGSELYADFDPTNPIFHKSNCVLNLD